MKHLFAIVTFVVLSCSVNVTEAGPLRRWNQNRLWSPGIIARLSVAKFADRVSGPRLVWRGDWVSVKYVR